MDEDLDGHVSGPGDATDVVGGKLAGEDDAPHAEPLDELDAQRLGEGHLRRPVDVQAGARPVDEVGQAQVLHDHGVGAGFGDRADGLHRLRKLVGEHQRVEGDVAADVVGVEVLHHPRQLFDGKVGRPVAGVEAAVEAEVHRVRPVGDGRPHRVPVPGGGEELGGGTLLRRATDPFGLGRCRHGSGSLYARKRRRGRGQFSGSRPRRLTR